MSNGADGYTPSRLHIECAFEKYQQIIKDETARSLESGLGRLAILVTGEPSVSSPFLPGKQVEFMNGHADSLAEEEAGNHQEVLIVRSAGSVQINNHLQDPETTDIAVIGHGTIATLLVKDKFAYTFLDVARAITHLKLGKFFQGMCGVFPSKRSVPLGTCAVERLSNVIAAAGEVIDERHPKRSLFVPVYSDDVDLMRQLASLRKKHYKSPEERRLERAERLLLAANMVHMPILSDS
jgi:hypothetical protein